MAEVVEVKLENLQNETAHVKRPKVTFLDDFSKLTLDKEKLRVKSGVSLLKRLAQSEPGEDRDAELKYALGRLVRGVGASENDAKAKFYSALAAFLSSVPGITVSKVLERVGKELRLSANNPKSENADVSFGQVLVCGAIMRTGLFLQATAEESRQIVETILTAGKQRSYLYLAAIAFVLELCEQQTTLKVFKETIWPAVAPELAKPWPEQTIDSVYFLSCLRSKYPQVVDVTFLRGSIECDEILCEQSLEPLAKMLVNIPRITMLNHPFFATICEQVGKSPFAVAFVDEVDRLLVRFNYNRHMIATKILVGVLACLTDSAAVPDLLTKNYVRLTLEYFKSLSKAGKKKDELRDGVYKLFEVIVEALRRDGVESPVKVAVIERFLFQPSGICVFERVTKSRVVQQLTTTLDGGGAKRLAELYRGVVTGGLQENGEGRAWTNNDRAFAAQLLAKLLGHAGVQDDLEWTIEQLTFLMDSALIKDEGLDNIGSELSESLRETFFQALDLKLPKLAHLRRVLSGLVHHVDRLIRVNGVDVFRNPPGPEAVELWRKAVAKIDRLEGKSKMGHVSSVFLTLYLHMALQVFADAKLATQTLEELFSCSDQIKRDRKGGDDGSLTTDDVDRPSWIEVVTDLFLNLLSRDSHPLRRLVGCVFPHLCKHVNATAISQILYALDPKTESNPLSAFDESDSEDESAGEGDCSDASEEMDAADEGNEIVNDGLRSALQAALGGGDDGDESVDLDEMSEAEGDKLDEALAQAFKQYKPSLSRKSKKQSKEDKALTHFRLRVLDLIDIYLDSGPSMSVCLEIMLPLLNLLEFCVRDAHQNPLANRVRACIKKLSLVKKFVLVEEVRASVLSDLLGSLLDKGTKNALIMQDLGDKVSDCCVFIVRCAQCLLDASELTDKFKRKVSRRVDELLEGALVSFFTERACLIPLVLFTGILKLTWAGNVALAGLLVGFAFKREIRSFRRTQALELLRIFFANHRLLSVISVERRDSEVSSCARAFTDNAVKTLNEVAANRDLNVGEKFACPLFTVLNAIKQCPVKFEEIDWIEVGECARAYRSRAVLSTDAKAAFNRLCKGLGVSNVVRANRPGVDNVGNTVSTAETEEKPVKNKTKKKLKNLKVKKESQRLRLQALSQGLSESFSFSDANVTDIKNEEGIDDEDGLKNSVTPVIVEQDTVEVSKSEESSRMKKKRKKSNGLSENQFETNGTDATEGLLNDRRKVKKAKICSVQSNEDAELLSESHEVVVTNGAEKKKSKKAAKTSDAWEEETPSQDDVDYRDAVVIEGNKKRTSRLLVDTGDDAVGKINGFVKKWKRSN